jgi:prepilin-type N-terminal cleavage/methylation domain-containing protein
MNSRGFSLIETLLSIAILAIIVPAAISAIISGNQTATTAGMQSRALFLAYEGLEAVRNIRDINFSNLTNGDHGLTISGNNWVFSQASDTTDIFTRTITITDAGKNRKDIISRVTWQKSLQQQTSVTLSTMLANWQETATPASCNEYAIQQGYEHGTCRKDEKTCKKQNETYLVGGDTYCTDGPSVDTCCAEAE